MTTSLLIAAVVGFATPGEAHDWRGAFDPTEAEWRGFRGSGRWWRRVLAVSLTA